MPEPTPTPDPVVTPDPEPAGTSVPVAAPPPKRPRRRLRKVALVFLVLLAVVGGAAPWLVAMPAVTGYALGLVNDRLKGSVGLGGLALSWTGPTELRDVRVRDTLQRDVLTIDRVSCPRGVWGLLTDYAAFDEVVIDAPRARLISDASGTVSLFEALQPRVASTSDEPLDIPDLVGRLVVNKAAVTSVRSDGTIYEVPAVGLTADVRTLAEIKGQFDARLADGSSLSGDVDVRKLVAGGRVNLREAIGRVNMKSQGRVDLAALAAVLAPESGLSGSADVNVQAVSEGDRVTADISLDLAGFAVGGLAGATTPVDLSVKGRLQRDGGAVDGRFELGGGVGELTAEVSAPNADRFASVRWPEFLAALLGGAAVELPQADVKATGSIDLAKLQRAAPRLLPARAGQVITSGRLEIGRLALTGGASPTISAAMAIKDLAATGDGRSIRMEPIALACEAVLEPGRGLRINEGSLRAAFADVGLRGSASTLEATFKANLSKMQQELGQVFDFGALRLEGECSGAIQLARQDESRVVTKVELSGAGVGFADGRRQLALQRFKASQQGAVTLRDRNVSRVEAARLEVDVEGGVALDGAGSFDLTSGALAADVNVTRLDLAFVTERLAGLLSEPLPRYAGGVRGRAKIERADSRSPWRSEGDLAVTGLATEGRNLLDGQTQLAWTDAEFDDATGAIRAAGARLQGAAATIDARQLALQPGRTLEARAEAKVSGELGRIMQVVGALTRSSPPALAGQAQAELSLSTSQNVITVVCRGGVDQFQYGSGDSAWREKRLSFETQTEVDQPRDRINVAKCQLASTPLTADLSGSISAYQGEARADLRGKYSASWDELTKILHTHWPSLQRDIVIRGKSDSRFELSGPLRPQGGRSALAGLKTSPAVEWHSADIFGVPVGSAKLTPTLENGRLVLPTAEVRASEGQVRLGGEVDFRPATPLLTIAGPLAVLQGVAVTPELGASLLSRINPIFLYLTRVEGRVSLQVQGLSFPLGEAIKTTSAGRGLLDLKEMQMEPGGLMAELFELGGMSARDLYPVGIGEVDLLVKDGRIHYDNFVLTFSKEFDLKFYGSVGFDDTVDLIISLPVREGLLRKLGVGGAAAEYARQLNDLRVDIPMVGTRQNPKLDFSRVDVDKLLRSVIAPRLLEKGIGDLLGAPKDPPAADPPPKRPPPKRPPKKPK